jgi:hypothetical protein
LTKKQAIQDATVLSVCVHFWGQAHDIHLLINTSGDNSDVEGVASALEKFGIVIVSKGGSW